MTILIGHCGGIQGRAARHELPLFGRTKSLTGTVLPRTWPTS
jgi:hypothetical protein